MAPNSATVASLLRQTVYYHLDNLNYDNALFCAERLQAHDPRTSESSYLLALCHLRLGNARSAYETSKPEGYRGGHLGSAFVFAQSCLALERYKDGITALEKARALWTGRNTMGKHGPWGGAPYPDMATFSCLLGKLYRGLDDKKKAISCFEDALRGNPFMWDAFTILCDMGVSVRIPNIFKPSDGLARNFDEDTSLTPQDPNGAAFSTPLEPLPRRAGVPSVLPDIHDPFDQQHSSTFQDIPTSNILLNESRQTDFVAKIAAARSRITANQGVVSDTNGIDTPNASTTAAFAQTMRLGQGEEANGVGTSSATQTSKRPPISRIMRPGSSGSSVGRVVSGNRKPMEENTMDIDEAPRAREASAVQNPQPKIAEPDTAKVDEALKLILDMLKKMASGYLHASRFQCQESLNAYSSLPRAHQDTPWVLAQMGRAQYEQTNYAEADKLFKRLRVIAPTRMEDMEVYSTILWHLNRETELSYLAHELIDAEWNSPQAWCTLGNAWSIARDHEQALKCFKRATQLDPGFAYAYTLQGHEHYLNEEYDKALTAYRHAMSADKRHYNAYYGVGKVYEKLGNYDKAFTHYHTASVIHPTHAVLITCIGTVLEKQKQIVPALQYFTKAAELAPKAAQTRYKKARALLAIGQLQSAQRELMVLNDIAPDDARVHFLLGKLSKTLRDKKMAVRYFTIALSLDPKASQEIKNEIESLEDDDILDDSMMH
ncbi:hypothetical protein P8C59_000393 [Phyllachora maydis]|uniref:Uncharacterized protein n=1 Tax=Phyllachora maydis TaxID=1825666 RepID=A0AAD9MA88_9PEZI|nr:hypothetical protein P8C59_000393 [Phyllachora maydis]